MARRNFKNKKDYRKDDKTANKEVSKDTPSKSEAGSESSEPNEGKKMNDPEWYMNDENLANAAANLPYSEPFGSTPEILPITGANGIVSIDPDGLVRDAVPGIYSLTIKPCIGKATGSMSDPINIAATQFYAHVRYVNSGRKNYDACDLMLYGLAIADMYSYLTWLQKIYSAAFTYSQRNYYIGKAILISMGVDPDDVLNNLANFRYQINALISKISTFAVPSVINLFKRKAFMYAGLYTESSDGLIKDQVYQFKPYSFFKYTLEASSKLGKLEQRVVNYSSLLKVTDLMAIGSDLLNEVFQDEDFGLMSGDILKAYGSEIITLAPIPEEMYIVPTFDAHVLSQFKNATISKPYVLPIMHFPEAGRSGMNTGDVYQTAEGNLVCYDAIEGAVAQLGGNQYIPACGQASVFGFGNPVLNVNMPDPMPADNMEATRLMSVYDAMPSNYIQNTTPIKPLLIVGGTEIAVEGTFYFAQGDGRTLGSVRDQRNVIPFYGTITGSNDDSIEIVKRLTNFKYAPIHYYLWMPDGPAWDSTLNGWHVENIGILSNVSNYTLVSRDIISRMHEVATLSLVYVPGVAKLLSASV